MWIWLAHFDLKVHVFRDAEFHTLYGWRLWLGILVVAVITAARLFLNAVFGLAVAKPGRPEIRPAFGEARRHAPLVIGAGVVVGVLLGMAALYVHRWGPPWFSVSMSITIVVAHGRLCVDPVAADRREDETLEGRVPEDLGCRWGARRDRVHATAPDRRIGILMLGSKVLFIPGIVFITIGATVQVGATGAVKAIKMSAAVAGKEPGRCPVEPRQHAEDGALIRRRRRGVRRSGPGTTTGS